MSAVEAASDTGTGTVGGARTGGGAGEAGGPAVAGMRRRIVRAGEALAYLALGIPLGLLAVVALALVAIGSLLSVVVIGRPLVHAGVAAGRWVADQDRRAANTLLVAHIPALPDRWTLRGSRRRSLDELRGDGALTRLLEHLASKLPLCVALLAAALLALTAIAGLLILAVKGLAGLGEPAYLGPVRTGPVSGVALGLLALPVAVLTIAGLVEAGLALRRLIRKLLLAPQAVAGGPVRELLAESLGDRTLSIAYWLPDRGIFVDEAGHPVSLPDPGSGRAWTAVERDGVRVAAILHDAELDTGPELVQAAAAAASLALDNERLKADLRARVEELRVSRVRIVEAADAARRRIERDLHDGAQQQLVSLALDLRLLKARLRDAEAASVVDDLAEKLGVALAELRELARGIHPVVLTSQGLGPAVRSVASRTAVPVDVQVDLGEEDRLSPPIEAAAYFLVAEALTNVVRYAGASGARVDVHREGDEVVVEVHDDGIGGADMAAGSGLRGLADRIAALEGTLRVHSPAGGGTHVEARIPCAAGSLVADAHEPPPAPPGSEIAPRAVLEAPT